MCDFPSNFEDRQNLTGFRATTGFKTQPNLKPNWFKSCHMIHHNYSQLICLYTIFSFELLVYLACSWGGYLFLYKRIPLIDSNHRKGDPWNIYLSLKRYMFILPKTHWIYMLGKILCNCICMVYLILWCLHLPIDTQKSTIHVGNLCQSNGCWMDPVDRRHSLKLLK